MQQRLTAQFPDYDISLEYYHSGDLAAKLQAEGADTACDIVFDCEYGYLQMLSDNFATIDFIDNSQFVADMQDPTRKYMPVDRYSGSVIVNTQVLADKGLPVPQSYEDLLDPMYKGLIEMPDPTASSTGYLFLKSLVNAWGEEKALAYFDQLDANILQYTGGGSAPVKDAAAGECAIALSLTFKAVDLINEGSPLQILFFAEGAPYTPAGLSILSGHENRQAVKDVVNYFYSDIIDDYLSTYLPEQIKVGQVNTTPNYPHRHPLRRHVQQHPQREGGAAGQMDALTRGTDAPKLSVRDCCKRFTGAPVLDHVSFDVASGEFLSDAAALRVAGYGAGTAAGNERPAHAGSLPAGEHLRPAGHRPRTGALHRADRLSAAGEPPALPQPLAV